MARPDRGFRAPLAYGEFVLLCVLAIMTGTVCLILGLLALSAPEMVGERLLEITVFATHWFFLLYAAGVAIVPFALGLLIPRKPWGWIAGLVLICAAMISVVGLPVALPAFLDWLEPETKRYFGRVPQSPDVAR